MGKNTYKHQDFDKLKKEAIAKGELFVDPVFKPEGNSLFYSKAAPSNVVWKRPGEMSRKPRLFIDGADASDFKQGQLGNCWFVAACACVAENQKLWKKIVPNYEKQEWGKDNKYAGIFHFQFYRQGAWLDVVIDDFLPTIDGQLMYTCSNNTNEYWSALLEKAYAKLFGDYESLTAGKAKDALVDMLGGVGQSIDLTQHNKNNDEKENVLFEQLMDAFEQMSQMTASISLYQADDDKKYEAHAKEEKKEEDEEESESEDDDDDEEEEEVEVKTEAKKEEEVEVKKEAKKEEAKKEEEEDDEDDDDDDDDDDEDDDDTDKKEANDVNKNNNNKHDKNKNGQKGKNNDGKAMAKGDAVEVKMPCGLIKGHAYSVTDVRRIRQGRGVMAFFKNAKLDMIRLRNPWGKTEWTGAWSDNSGEWKNVSDREKKDCGLVISDNGEFWMSFKDFLDNFTSIDICHMINTSVFSISKTWSCNDSMGNWTRGDRDGGCANNETFLNNPQYTIDIKELEADVMFSLEQEDQRMNRRLGKDNATIGVTILKADLNREYRMHDKLERIAVTEFSNSRSVFHRMILPRGRYLIVPSTFDPGFETSYWLRVYCGTNLSLRELKEEMPKKGGCLGPKYRQASHLIINKAAELMKTTGKETDPYCIVKCEGKEWKTPVCRNTVDPVWKWRMVLYTKSTHADIIVEMWNQNTFADDFLGRAVIQGISTKFKEDEMYAYPLMGKGKTAAEYMKGKISLQFKHFQNMEEA